MWGDDPVFIEKEETSNGVYDQWSDGNGNQVHTITVSHPDYQVDTREIAFTQDRDITVTMSANPANQTLITGTSTITGTVTIN